MPLLYGYWALKLLAARLAFSQDYEKSIIFLLKKYRYAAKFISCYNIDYFLTINCKFLPFL